MNHSQAMKNAWVSKLILVKQSLKSLFWGLFDNLVIG